MKKEHLVQKTTEGGMKGQPTGEASVSKLLGLALILGAIAILVVYVLGLQDGEPPLSVKNLLILQGGLGVGGVGLLSRAGDFVDALLEKVQEQ